METLFSERGWGRSPLASYSPYSLVGSGLHAPQKTKTKKAAMFVLGGDGCEVIGVKVHNNEEEPACRRSVRHPPLSPLVLWMA